MLNMIERLILFNYSQKLLEVIVKAVGFAKEHYLNSPGEWQEIINTVNCLLPKKDIEKFKEFCTCVEYGLSECDTDHVHDFKIILNGDEEDKEEVYDLDNMPTDRFEETEKEREVLEGFLDKEMWKGYKEWLSRCPEESDRFEKFLVRNCSFIVFV